jgi:hypothetical protein
LQLLVTVTTLRIAIEPVKLHQTRISTRLALAHASPHK